MSKNEHIVRHPLTVRLTHWLIASSGLLLTFSGIGFMPLYGRFYLNELPGMQWVSDFQTQMNVHYLSAALFMAACIFHVLYHLKRKEFALIPRRGDVMESWLIIKAMLCHKKEPAHDKFLAEQRIAYAAFAFTIAALIVSGYFLALKNSMSFFIAPETLQLFILGHLTFTFLFILQVALHLAAFLIKANRPLLGTMFNGQVEREYAEKRHPRWFKRVSS